MRALLPLLAVLAAAAPAAPPAPPALLVLRAACHALLLPAFDEARFLSYTPARSHFAGYRVRILSYKGEEVRRFFNHYHFTFS